LLGQYSDDELDEEPNKELNHATVESSSPNDEVINGLFLYLFHSGCEGSTSFHESRISLLAFLL
jgi:hypothetical protein